ncbi:MAG: hypothetical protein SNJ84_10720, partial [Verrucomicrobiia bacterium]
FLAMPLASSIFFHGLIILLIGGAVLVPGIVPQAPFVGEVVVPSALEPTDDFLEFDTEIGEVMPEMVEVAALPEPAAAMPEATFDVINVAVPTSSFSLPVGSGVIGSGVDAFGTGTGTATGGNQGVQRGGVVRDFFGSTQASAGTLAGTFYDLKQTRNRQAVNMDNPAYHQVVNRAAANGMRVSELERFFQAPVKLYARQFFFPLMSAGEGPRFFKVDNEVKPTYWLVHYTGTAVAPFTGRFRFVGRAGETLMVLWNNRLVLDACHSFMHEGPARSSSWRPRDNVGKFPSFNRGRWAPTEHLVFGDWIDVVANAPANVDILLGERGGGDFYCFLLWEGPGAQGREDKATGMMAFPIWTTNFADPAIPQYTPGPQGPPVIR